LRNRFMFLGVVGAHGRAPLPAFPTPHRAEDISLWCLNSCPNHIHR